MNNNQEKSKNISLKNENAGRDVARLGIFIIGVAVLLYLLTIAVLPIYAR